jgi:CRP/FNR family transcriptional regulator, cyclic AMP receptor protein
LTRGADFLESLQGPDRDALTALGTRRAYRRGTAAFHERQEADAVLLVLAGHLKVTLTSPEGKEAVIAFRGPGELVGELAALDGGSRSATAVALEDSEALVIPASAFRDFLRAHPDAAMALLRTLSDRLREGAGRLLELSAYDTLGRLSARLVELAEGHGEQTGDGIRIRLPLTQEELAGSIGASREAATKALQSLRELGWVRTGRREIEILDLSALRGRAALIG